MYLTSVSPAASHELGQHIDDSDDVHTWLVAQLKEERTIVTDHIWDLVRILERRHAEIIAEVDTRVSGNCLTTLTMMPPKRETPSLNAPCCPVSEKKAWPETIPPYTNTANSPSRNSDVKQKSRKRFKSKLVSGMNNPTKNSRLKNFVSSLGFEIFSGVLIIANIIVMAMELQYRGLQLGYDLDIDHYDRPASNVWPGADKTFLVIEMFFNIVFALELLLRIGAEKREAFRSAFVWLDIVLVVTGLIEVIVSRMDTTASFINPTMMKVVRLVRVVRVLKVVRSVRSLDSLYLIVRSITASVGACFWSFNLLLFIQIAVGMFLTQMIRRYMEDASEDVVLRRQVFLYWGTFTRTMVTMFEVTLGNWVPSCRVLIDNVHELYGLVYIFYRCMFCFAVVRVISAVFITETQRVSSHDDEMAIMKQRRARKQELQKLRDIFDEIDSSGDGYIEWAEMEKVLKDPLMVQWLRTLDVDVDDVEEIFALLDDGDGQISCEEFINGINRMRGHAKAIDMVGVVQLIHRVDAKLELLLPASNPRKC